MNTRRTVHLTDAKSYDAWGGIDRVRVAEEKPVRSGMGAAVSDEDIGRDLDTKDAATAAAPRYSRRLSDKILIAFHHACDQADFEVADQLLQILEMMLTRRPLTADSNRRRNMESLVAAHERLWYLRHPNPTIG